MKKPLFKEGDYVTDGDSVCAVLEVDKDGLMHLEDCRSGNSWDLCDPKHYKKCARPPSMRHELLCLRRAYAVKIALNYREVPVKDILKRFQDEAFAILRKHS